MLFCAARWYAAPLHSGLQNLSFSQHL
jgi:hypothetical protein